MEFKIANMEERKKPLYITVYDELYKLIMNGTFMLDSKLPAEPELAKMFGVSRMTLRQSLSLLQDDGLVKRVHGKGNFITKIAINNEKIGIEKIGNPLYKSHTKQIDDVEMSFRIDLDSEYTQQVLCRKSAAVVAFERWYKSAGEVVAYAFTNIAIEAVAELNLDLQDNDQLLEMLETRIYKLANRSTIDIKRSASVNSSSQKHKVDGGEDCDLLLESIFIHEDYPLVYNKFYIPKEYSCIKVNAVK
ncbi:GntR family transcriptional regulator [Viridibacillus sp. FSL R5-0477]|uniref:GntR family transcriptional regulator n=1 Tax=Viridibacillus arenosi FSL R5-213 TaxID=1227360 RepID=W4EZZ5_9BACL|nr:MULTISPECIES: GntR family transcriptional regulator [Viridibacillus]ETT86168.1 GntR family transcriptional regulator [Viridibacillus arenosi FSL R5-213]OMC84929.1 GntR family transcriptional regulator [Viridibacillus sp. FSL H8-0123]OMC85732.1 GntR family transcriptional regulator [Viridibacillus sp. FSL H7-0596]OMC91974.1 GntR family transcriptional regulator [Viridibacillus arenosi]